MIPVLTTKVLVRVRKKKAAYVICPWNKNQIELCQVKLTPLQASKVPNCMNFYVVLNEIKIQLMSWISNFQNSVCALNYHNSKTLSLYIVHVCAGTRAHLCAWQMAGLLPRFYLVLYYNLYILLQNSSRFINFWLKYAIT